MTHRRTMICGFIAAICSLTWAQAFASDMVLTNARIIDGTGGPPRERQSIKIVSGRISEIGEDIDSRGLPTVDVHGSRVLPGFIDAHVHLKTIPGTAFRQDDDATFNQLFEHQMRAYLASGVTSVLDAASPEDVFLRVKRYQTFGGAGPNAYFLAPFLTPDKGYFGSDDLRDKTYKSMWKAIDSKESVVASFDQAKHLKPIGAKATVEYGFGPFRVWPVFPKEMRQFIQAQAASRGVPLFIHSFSEEAHRLALEMNPRALLHAGFPREKPSDGILNTMKKQNVFVVSTQTIYDMSLLEWQQSRLDEPAYKLLVPEVQLQTAHDPRAWSFAREKITKTSAPTWIPTFGLIVPREFFKLYYLRIFRKISSSTVDFMKASGHCMILKLSKLITMGGRIGFGIFRRKGQIQRVNIRK